MKDDTIYIVSDVIITLEFNMFVFNFLFTLKVHDVCVCVYKADIPHKEFIRIYKDVYKEVSKLLHG